MFNNKTRSDEDQKIIDRLTHDNELLEERNDRLYNESIALRRNHESEIKKFKEQVSSINASVEHYKSIINKYPLSIRMNEEVMVKISPYEVQNITDQTLLLKRDISTLTNGLVYFRRLGKNLTPVGEYRQLNMTAIELNRILQDRLEFNLAELEYIDKNK